MMQIVELERIQVILPKTKASSFVESAILELAGYEGKPGLAPAS